MPRGVKPPADSRWCTKCEEYKPSGDFYPIPNALCKEHYREYDSLRKKEMTRLHPGRYSEQVLAWAKAHPERIREHQRRFGQKLVASGKGKLKYRKWVEKDPEAARARWREQYRRKYAKDPAYFYYRTINRRALRKNARGSCTRQEVGELLRKYGYSCLYCGEKATTLDHIVPLHRGGTNFLWNLAPACRSCNAHKGAKDPLSFVVGLRMSRSAKARVNNSVRRHKESEGT